MVESLVSTQVVSNHLGLEKKRKQTETTYLHLDIEASVVLSISSLTT